ncbi:Type II secretion system protein C [Candidatus Electrothrix laxa]
MVRVVAILAGIFLAAYVAVHLGYARLEKELQNRSCFSKTEQPVTETANRAKGGKQNQPQASRRPLSAKKQPAENNTLDFQVIIRRNIFQLVQEESVSTEQSVAVQKTAPEEVPTTLKLTLLGTVLGDDQTSRAIIIEEKQNEQKLYQIGDAVQGAIIESIERGKVILEVFGSKETLVMKKREGGGSSQPPRSDRISSPRSRPAPDLVEDDAEEIDEDNEDNEDELVEKKQVRTRRRPPSVRPNRRISFRRNPIRNTESDLGDEEEESMNEEEDAEIPAIEEEFSPFD